MRDFFPLASRTLWLAHFRQMLSLQTAQVTPPGGGPPLARRHRPVEYTRIQSLHTQARFSFSNLSESTLKKLEVISGSVSYSRLELDTKLGAGWCGDKAIGEAGVRVVGSDLSLIVIACL